jgi:hypothetical protein
MADYIPSGDGDFDTFVENFATYINAHLAEFGLVAADMTAINAALVIWNAAFTAHEPAQTAANAATQAKETARNVLVALIRALVKIIHAKGAAVTAASKQAINVTVADTIKTPVAVPTSAPVGRVDITNVREHTIHFSDSTTPTSKAKPPGVRGCQIWVKIGTAPPASASELVYRVMDTSSPFKNSFEPADAGKTAYYWLRWENTKGESGPWSAMVSATITG